MKLAILIPAWIFAGLGTLMLLAVLAYQFALWVKHMAKAVKGVTKDEWKDVAAALFWALWFVSFIGLAAYYSK